MMATQDEKGSVILIMRPGSIRNGLLALLKSIKNISTIETSQDPLGGLDWVAARHPHLAIVECNRLGDQVESLLQDAKRRSPTTSFVLFAENMPAHAEAVDLQVEAVIQQGAPPDEWVRLVESLILESIKIKGDVKNE